MSKTTKQTNIDMTITPKQLPGAINDIMGTGFAAFVWGPPGIGKSQILKQVANDKKFDTFEDIRLSQMDPTDLRGVPMPVTVEGRDTIRWSEPDFYDPKTQDGTRKAFYLFDEMNSAPQSTQAAAYQIVLDRKIGPHRLGPNDFVAAAGNRETDRGSTFKMPTPLLNRFVHLELRSDPEEWLEYAALTGFNPAVVGYLTFAKNHLMNFEPSSASRGFATPRSWEMVSKILNKGPQQNDLNLQITIGGAIGDGIAAPFMTYRRRALTLPNPSDILNGKIKEFKNARNEVDLMYTLVTAMCYELRALEETSKVNKELVKTGSVTTNDVNESQKKYEEGFDYFIDFMMNNFTDELIIMGARTALSIYKMKVQAEKIKCWKKFTAQYASMIIEA